VVLTAEARERRSRSEALDVGSEVRGRFMNITGDSLTLATRLRNTTTAGMSRTDVRRAITLGRDDIREVTVPRLDRGRTGLVVGAAVVVLALVIGDVLNLRGDADSPEPGPTPDPGAPFTGGR
jgi:hypothetical protein